MGKDNDATIERASFNKLPAVRIDYHRACPAIGFRISFCQEGRLDLTRRALTYLAPSA